MTKRNKTDVMEITMRADEADRVMIELAKASREPQSEPLCWGFIILGHYRIVRAEIIDENPATLKTIRITMVMR